MVSEAFGLQGEDFDPKEVRLGDTILVDYTRLAEFARHYLPKIQDKIILITPNFGHDADNSLPGPFERLLNEEKIAAWFVQNIDRACSGKLIPIPIGLASKNWPHGNTKLLDLFVRLSLAKKKRSILCYVNFIPVPVRKDCFAHFQKLGIKMEERKSFSDYLNDLADSIFVVSPPGGGIDCHRTWEALLMGCYPIVLSSTLHPLYEGLPVVSVADWSEVTEEFLEEKIRELSSQTWYRDRLYAPYWFERVREIQNRIRS
jgi:hypothetical protein